MSSIVDSVFEQSLVNDSSANTAYIYWSEEACEDRLAALWYAPAAKKWHKQTLKCNEMYPYISLHLM